MDADNTIERCYDVTSRTLKWTFHELIVQGVDLRGTLLKPNMVISGKGCPEQAPAARIAELTIQCFMTHVPAAVPGIVFLSGGQSEVEATENLNAINQLGGPWPLSFSYGRALQASALEVWGGDAAQHRGRAGGVRPPRADERARSRGRVERRDGAAGRRVGARLASLHVDRHPRRARSARGASPRGSESARAERRRCAPRRPRSRRSGARRSTAGRRTTPRAGSSSTGGASTRSARPATSRTPPSRSRCASTIRRSSTTARAPSTSRAPRRRTSTACATSCSASSPRPSSRSRAAGTRSSGGRSSRSSR